MSNLAQHQISSGRGGNCRDGLETRSQSTRPRFGSAPAATHFSTLQLDQSREQNPNSENPSGSMRRCIGDGGRLLHQKCKCLVETYAPVQWQSNLLNSVESVSEYLDNRLLHQELPTVHFTRENWARQLKLWGVWLLVAGLATVSIILLFSLIATLTSRLVLPFYAIFGAAYWALIWRKRLLDPISDRGHSEDLAPVFNHWWFAVAAAEVMILLIRKLAIGEISSVSNGWFDQLAHSGILLAAWLGAKMYVDSSAKDSARSSASSPTASMTSEQLVCLLPYLLLTYAIRYFALRGFTLLPAVVRPFLAYSAGHIAVLAAQRRTDAFPSSQPSMHVCYCSDQGARSVSHPALTNVATLHPKQASNRYHGLPEGEFLRFASSTNRSSRRVSLPAGSLVPSRAQSNISEAHGLIADMLAQKDMPPYLVSGLKAVSSLLLPANQTNSFLFAPSNFDFLGKLPRLLDTPYFGADASLASVESVGQRRASPIVVTWSTTTSATGLPTVEPEPSRARSSSYWKNRHTIDDEDDDENQHFKEIMKTSRSVVLDSTLIQLSDGTLYSLTEIETDNKLARIEDWSLPIFDLYADSPETVLTRVAYTIFQRSDFFRIFKISKQKFFSFFHALEKGYWNIPYHNRIHATDVMHATYYFATTKVPALLADDPDAPIDQFSTEDTTDSDGDGKTEEENRRGSVPNGFEGLEAFADEKCTGTLASVLSSLEIMALYTAAAMHDYDHPGRTNAFLVAIEDEKAILYNDRSVLENHHAAASWKLLNRPENNFVEHLDAAEFKRFRYMIIEAILATDLKRHFEILMDFNGKVSSRGLDWDNESDKLLTCQICIKMADISSPTKPYPLHREWTNRIVEEFYAQGDEERQRGLPVSPYMDRDHAQLATLQDSFITHLVTPLAQAMYDAGLLTLSTISTESPDPNSVPKPELLINLECNRKYWKAQLDEVPNEQTAASVPSNAHADNGGAPSGTEMETIQEQEDENASTPAEASP